MRFEINVGNLFFMSELLLAELIFLCAAPKKPRFGLRLSVGVILAIGAAILFPYIGTPEYQLLWNLFRFTWLFSVSVLVMYLSFEIQLNQILSMCVSGYAVQHMAYRVVRIILGPHFDVLTEGNPVMLRSCEVGIIFLTYLIVFFTFGRFCAKNECYKYRDMRFNYLACVMIFICIGANRLLRLLGEDPYTITANIYAFLSCLLALYIQFNLHKQIIMQKENEMLHRIRLEEEKQFEVSRNAMEALQIRVHDLKHLLAAGDSRLPRQEMEEIQEMLGRYEASTGTGSTAVDVLLTENLLKCQKKGIRLDWGGDFAALDFLAAIDLYSLFGNAIDNAVEAVEKLSDPEKKIIDISVEQRGDMVFTSFTNYYSGAMIMENGLPQTTKQEEKRFHGFGLKSMQRTAEKYGGQVSVTVHGEMFNLVICVRDEVLGNLPNDQSLVV